MAVVLGPVAAKRSVGRRMAGLCWGRRPILARFTRPPGRSGAPLWDCSLRDGFSAAQWFTPRLEIVPIFVLPTLVLVMILATPWIGRRPSAAG